MPDEPRTPEGHATPKAEPAPRGDAPRTIRLHETDNVAIVVNAFGLPAGTAFPDGLTLREFVPQGHKVALRDIPEGGEIRRYGEVIGTALQALPRGSWVEESRVQTPLAPALDQLPLATRVPAPLPPLDGYTFEGFAIRTARSAPATSWRSRPACNASPAPSRWRSGASRRSCCRAFPTSTT